jgi:NAD+ diphosphatase
MPMPPDKLGFVANTIDRAANRRSDPQWIESLKRADGSRLVCLSGDRVRIAEGHAAHSSPMESEDPIFLGLDATGRAWFAKEDSFDGGHDLRSVAVSGLVPPEEMGFLAQARALLAWHGRRAFCSNCGARLVVRDAGYRRHCEACKSDHFPRTDPVVIMLVVDGDRCLLGRQPGWPKPMVSALAGFVEAGETLEEAVRREVREEAGIQVGAIHYVASQPWPFPASLMIGCQAEAVSRRIQIDATELESADWFTKDEVRAALEAPTQRLGVPPPIAIAHHLIQAWVAG